MGRFCSSPNEMPRSTGRVSSICSEIRGVVTVCRGTPLADVDDVMTQRMNQAAASPRVLVADDQPDVRDALRMLLRDAGFRSDAARSVQEVRERVTTGGYDLLLMDLNYARDTTSGHEGLDLLAEVHASDPTLPVIVMTGRCSIPPAGGGRGA